MFLVEATMAAVSNSFVGVTSLVKRVCLTVFEFLELVWRCIVLSELLVTLI